MTIEQPTTEYEAPDIDAAKDTAAEWIAIVSESSSPRGTINLARAFLDLLDDLGRAESERDALQRELHETHKM